VGLRIRCLLRRSRRSGVANRKVHPGRHEAIIDEQTFDAVQAIVAERADSQALKRGHPSDYMLSGVLRCGRCQKGYVGTAAHGRKSRYRYYVCSTRYRYGTKICDGARLPMEVLEDAVVEQMAEVFADTGLVGEALALSRAEEVGASEKAGRRLASIQQQLAGARRSLESVLRRLPEAEERTIGETGGDGLSKASILSRRSSMRSLQSAADIIPRSNSSNG
jgi:hypothetical protein